MDKSIPTAALSGTPAEFSDPEAIVDAILKRQGNKIVLALPLGLGKANHIANALTDRALKDTSIDLEIITALTLETPKLDNEFKRRLLEPALSRLFGDYPPLKYVQLLRDKRLPANIRVSEFFMLAGQWLTVEHAQQNYIPANYTHALKCLLKRGVNVIAQLLATSKESGALSLSCNPDISAELLTRRQAGQCRFLFVGECNSELPFMGGAAVVEPNEVDLLLRSEITDFQLFSTPKQAVSLSEHAIGLHAAQLVRDGGTLQIGIGAIGDAVTHALLLRHRDPELFTTLLQRLARPSNTGLEQRGAFREGMYGVSEMFVEGFLHLAEQGILKRQVDGAVLHSSFFVDSRSFYQRLNQLTEEDRAIFQMVPASFTNALYGDEVSKRQARVKSAFINSAMMVTLRGAVVSDALEDGRVVSGVGGQHDFAVQAFALDDARFIITLNATRQRHGKTVSNIVWSYAHETLPWHLRDIVITEYGVADLRGTNENQAVKAMLKIADSRFQGALLAQAQKAGKVERDWRIPAPFTSNTPAQLKQALHTAARNQTLPRFPLGTDFNPTEQRLLPALEVISQHANSRLGLVRLAWRGLRARALSDTELKCLQRMELQYTAGVREYLYKLLLKAGLVQSRPE